MDHQIVIRLLVGYEYDLIARNEGGEFRVVRVRYNGEQDRGQTMFSLSGHQPTAPIGGVELIGIVPVPPDAGARDAIE